MLLAKLLLVGRAVIDLAIFHQTADSIDPLQGIDDEDIAAAFSDDLMKVRVDIEEVGG